jgi:hypothetical protein
MILSVDPFSRTKILRSGRRLAVTHVVVTSAKTRSSMERGEEALRSDWRLANPLNSCFRAKTQGRAAEY